MDDYTGTEMRIERVPPEPGDGAVATVVVTGEIDLSVADRFAAGLGPDEPGGGRPVLVDMTGVKFIDSSGIRVLLTAHRELTATGSWGLVLEPGSVVERTLELTSVTDVLPTFSSREQALAELAP